MLKISKQRKYQLKQISQGKCILCNNILVTRQYCSVHKKKQAKSMKEYSLQPKGRRALNEASKRAYIKHKEKFIARACEVCEKNKLLQGHHEDYNKPLEVIWLCSRCHADEHNYLKTLKKNQ
jgi:hypothetical protein